jgi:hypothetical protein
MSQILTDSDGESSYSTLFDTPNPDGTSRYIPFLPSRRSRLLPDAHPRRSLESIGSLLLPDDDILTQKRKRDLSATPTRSVRDPRSRNQT